jgi:GntR family transcriptional regulator, vanillate catabolism transcriptional regulator
VAAVSDAKTSHSQRALITLRQRILAGALPGGTRLAEVALAEELGISRTPIRAALSRLAEEALLERKGAGFIVRRFDLADVVDAIELRGVLEGTAARLAAERGALASDLAEAHEILSEIDKALRGALDLDAYSTLNSRFHALLSAMAQSPVLQTEIARISGLPFAAPSAFIEDTRARQLAATLTLAQSQHRALIEAITAREGARAEALAREHARAARRNAEELLARQR